MINSIIKILLNKKLITFLSKVFLKVQVKGLENIKDLQDKVLFIANHNSFIDTFLLWVFIPENLCFTINPIVKARTMLITAIMLANLTPLSLIIIINWATHGRNNVKVTDATNN